MGQNRQPQYPARIDRSSAYASRLAFAWSAAFPNREQAIGLRSNTDNTGKATAPPGRVVSSSAGQVNLEWSNQFITTSSGDGLGDFTIAVYANPAASGSTVEHVFAQKNDAGGSPFSQCALLAHADVGASFSSGSFSFFTFNGAGSAGAAASGVCDGEYHWWKGVRRGNQHDLYKDGVLIASSSNTPRGITQPTPRYTAIGSRGNGTTESYTRQAVAACAWNRALSSGEVADSPWKLWLAPDGYIAMDALAGGASGSLAYTNVNDSVSASGVVGSTVTGSSSTVNADDTAAASGGTTIVGALSRANASDTVVASGITTVTGSLAVINANDMATASGAAGAVSGTVSYTNRNDACSASGSTPNVQTSGGFFEMPQVRRHRSIKEDRERLGIIPREVKQIVKAVARATVAAEKTDTQAQVQLSRRLEQQDIEAKAKYAEFMRQERDRLRTQAIARAVQIQRRKKQLEDEEDDRDAVMLLMS